LASRFEWTVPNTGLQVAQPVSVRLEARSLAGHPVTDFTNAVSLAVAVPGTRPASLLITEIQPSAGVEFLNGSTHALDLSGWEVSLYDSSTWPRPRTTFVFPPQSAVEAGKLLVLRPGGTAPGSGSTFFTGQPLNWTFNNANRVIAVLLRDSAGDIVDFFGADQAFPEAITEPVSVPITEWIGRPIARLNTSFDAYQRLSSRDQQAARDWLVCIESFGKLNPYGGPVFGPGLTVQKLEPASTDAFREGAWSGLIYPTQSGSEAWLVADDRQGRVGTTAVLTVSASPEVLLELPPSLAEGSSISARVRLPAVLTTNLTVNLESSWPARLPVPPTVEIPAGATEVSLILTVPNDERLQGVQSVSLFVQANGFARTQQTIEITDDETTQLSLALSGELREGGPEGTGVITVGTAAERPVVLQLAVDRVGQLILPISVILPAGQTQVSFSVRAVNDGVIDGPLAVAITVQAGNWTPATASVTAVDNEDRQLRLSVPARIRGSAPTNAQVFLSGTLPTDLEITVNSSDPRTLAVPQVVRIAAGSTNAAFELQGISGEPWHGSTLVQVTVSAVEFQAAAGVCDVWEERERQVTLAVTDLVYHRAWDRLLAAVAARDGTYPDTLVVVNPHTGEIERSLSVATDPSSLALTEDGKVLWVGSYGDSSVQRVDLDSFAVTETFSLEGHWPVQLMARRGRNDSVIVYRYKTNAGNEIALYSQGIRQPDAIVPGFLMFLGMIQGEGDRLFAHIPQITSGNQPQVHEYKVTDTGLVWQRTGPEDSGAAWVWADGQLYSSRGRVRDATTFEARPGIAGLNHEALVVEPERQQGFYLTAGDGRLYLTRASLSLRAATDAVSFPYTRYELGYTRPVRWGDAGLAFRADDTLYLLESAYVEPGPSANLVIHSSLPTNLKLRTDFAWTLTVSNAGPAAATVVRLEGALPTGLEFVRAEVPGGTGVLVYGGWNATLPPLPAGASTTVTVHLRPSLAGPQSLTVLASQLQRDASPADNSVAVQAVIRLDPAPDTYQMIDLAAADLCFDPVKNELWATVPDPTPEGRNDRLVRLSLETGLIVAEFPAGRLPGRLIRSDDGRSLYVALDGESLIQRFDLLTESWGAKLALFDYVTNSFPARNRVTDMVVFPGEPERVVATWRLPQFEFSDDPGYYRTVAFRDAVRLPNEVPTGLELERGPGADEVVTFTGAYDYLFARLQLTDSGLFVIESKPGVLGALDIRVEGQRLYNNAGLVVELPGLEEVRNYGVNPVGPVLPLLPLNRVIYLDNGGFFTSALLAMKVFDATSGRLIQDIPFGAERSAARPLIHCGGDRLAFRAFDNFVTPNRVVVFRTSAIPSTTVPADIQVQLTLRPEITQFNQDAEFFLTVTNAGPGVAERVRYALPWVGNARATNASRGTITHDYYGGVRGFVNQLAPGETVEVYFRTRTSEAGRFQITASAYSAAPDPVAANDSVTSHLAVAWMPRLGQTTTLQFPNVALVSDREGRRLFASTVEGVVQIDPALGEVDPSSRFGRQPGPLAVSADESSLWVAFDQERQLRRHRLSNGQVLQTVELVGTGPVRHLASHPTEPGSVVFAQRSVAYGVKEAVAVPLHNLPTTQVIQALAFAPDGAVLVARSSLDNFEIQHPLERYGFAGNLFGQSLAVSPREWQTTSLRVAGDRVYLDNGAVNEALTLADLPVLDGVGSPAPLPVAQRVAYLHSFNRLTLRVVDLTGVVPTQPANVGG